MEKVLEKAEISIDVTDIANKLTREVNEFLRDFVREEIINQKRGYAIGDEYVLFPPVYLQYLQYAFYNDNPSIEILQKINKFVERIFKVVYGDP